MLNHLASLAMSISVLKALPGKLDTKRHSPSILQKSLPGSGDFCCLLITFANTELNNLSNLANGRFESQWKLYKVIDV